jgi:hypothetical protein
VNAELPSAIGQDAVSDEIGDEEDPGEDHEHHIHHFGPRTPHRAQIRPKRPDNKGPGLHIHVHTVEKNEGAPPSSEGNLVRQAIQPIRFGEDGVGEEVENNSDEPEEVPQDEDNEVGDDETAEGHEEESDHDRTPNPPGVEELRKRFSSPFTLYRHHVEQRRLAVLAAVRSSQQKRKVREDGSDESTKNTDISVEESQRTSGKAAREETKANNTALEDKATTGNKVGNSESDSLTRSSGTDDTVANSEKFPNIKQPISDKESSKNDQIDSNTTEQKPKETSSRPVLPSLFGDKLSRTRDFTKFLIARKIKEQVSKEAAGDKKNA